MLGLAERGEQVSGCPQAWLLAKATRFCSSFLQFLNFFAVTSHSGSQGRSLHSAGPTLLLLAGCNSGTCLARKIWFFPPRGKCGEELAWERRSTRASSHQR